MSSIASKIAADGAAKSKMAAADYFVENNPHGYGSRPIMKQFLEEDDQNNDKLEGILNLMGEETNINNLPTVITDDKDGYEFTYVRFEMARGNPPIRLKLVERMINFIRDYQMGKISPGFTLAQLYEEACKQ